MPWTIVQLSPKPWMTESRSSTVCVVVEWPDHHHGDDYVLYWWRNLQVSQKKKHYLPKVLQNLEELDRCKNIPRSCRLSCSRWRMAVSSLEEACPWPLLVTLFDFGCLPLWHSLVESRHWIDASSIRTACSSPSMSWRNYKSNLQ